MSVGWTCSNSYVVSGSKISSASVGPMWREIQSASRVACAEPVTIRKRSAASRITVQSLSKPPRAFSIAV